MSTEERHQANIELLDGIIGIAGGIRQENRRLSFRMEQAAGGNSGRACRGEKSKNNGTAEESYQVSDEEIDLGSFTNSTDLKKGLKKRVPVNQKKANPFDFRKNNNTDRKLDAILSKLQTVSTKDDLRVVNKRIDGMEERLSKLERRRGMEEERWGDGRERGRSYSK